MCTCRNGFEGDPYESCVDVNECDSSLHGCSFDAQCNNNDGGFQCTCNKGFLGDGINCRALADVGV